MISVTNNLILPFIVYGWGLWLGLQISLVELSIYCSNKESYWHNIQLANFALCLLKKFFLSFMKSIGDKVVNMGLSFTSHISLEALAHLLWRGLHLGDASASAISISLCVLQIFPQQILELLEYFVFRYNSYFSYYLQPLLAELYSMKGTVSSALDHLI